MRAGRGTISARLGDVTPKSVAHNISLIAMIRRKIEVHLNNIITIICGLQCVGRYKAKLFIHYSTLDLTHSQTRHRSIPSFRC